MFNFGVDVDELSEEATIVFAFVTFVEEEIVFATGAFEEEAVFETGALEEEAVFETGVLEEEAVFETGAFEEGALFETGALEEAAVFETGALDEEAVFKTGALEEEVSATDLELDAKLSVTSALELLMVDSGGSMLELVVRVIVGGMAVAGAGVVSLAKAVLRIILAPNGSCN